ncbi:MAG: ADP-forming succinate--CoA ligase subunit beta [Deltaproteobacteria bacterium]|nr:ADP-forming succinate--CoA ligase subunit beta [Deltaproteobacteria bacterium]
MNIHEYQAKRIFRSHQVPVPEGYLARSPVEAEFAFRRLNVPVAVVKAQVHAGGRGKAGGVKLANSPEACRAIADTMLGMTLRTHQTGEDGKLVRKVYIEAGSDIAKEYYLALLVDRETANIAVMFSLAGGMDIEEVASKTPEKIITVRVDPTIGLHDFLLRELLFRIDIPQEEKKQLKAIIQKLYSLFQKHDFSLLEINPLVVTKDGKMLALDGKMNFDDNALFRQKEIDALRDFDEEDMREVEASKHGLSYIGLDGSIGCMVNGAGLAMSTMDIIKVYGGEPANFLDVGGGANEDQVKNAFRIILQDKKVEGIFVNIFGGIMRCDVIAKGIIHSGEELGVKVPLVVRLEGTNVQEGKAILAKSNLDIISAEDMADGARKVVEAVKQAK